MPYIGCKSWSCQRCIYYWPYLSVTTMQTYCWNQKRFFTESKNGKNLVKKGDK